MSSPIVIFATTTKPSKDSEIGFGVGPGSDGKIRVTSIDPKGLFAGTCLHTGMGIISINGKDYSAYSEGVKLLKEAEGPVTIEASGELNEIIAPRGEPKEIALPAAIDASPIALHATATKPSKDSEMGFGVGRGSDGKITLTSIDPRGLFGRTGLKVGMKMKSINGKDYTTYDEGITLLKDSEGEVKIEAIEGGKTIEQSIKENILCSVYRGPAQQNVDDIVSIVTLSTTKPTRDSEMGFGVGRGDDGKIKVTSIDPKGLFAGSALRTGMKIDSIDGHDYRTYDEGIALLKKAEGEVTIEAIEHKRPIQQAVENIASSVVVCVTKPSKDSQLGFGLGCDDRDNEKIKVTSIDPRGQFAGSSLLKAGMRIDAINGKKYTTYAEGLALLNESEGKMTITAINDVVMETILLAINDGRPRFYRIDRTGPNTFKAEHGSRRLNRFGGFLVQHFSFDIMVNDDGRVLVHCNLDGWDGGLMGVIANKYEMDDIRVRLKDAFPGRIVELHLTDYGKVK